jgi:hypothetical protein
LEKGQRFCTLYVLDVADGIVPYDKPPKQIPSAPRMELTARVRDYIQSNGNYFVVISVIVNIIVLIYQLFF